MTEVLPYRDLNSYLKERFGARVQKVTLDAGLTCPNRDGRVGVGGCLYCNARGSGTGASARGLSVTQQLEEGMQRMARRYGASRFIAYFQSFSNTYAPVEQLRALYHEALAFPEVVGLSIGTRPDCLTPEILDLLADIARNRLLWLELGLQSAHDKTLKLINRGHDAACFTQAVKAAADRNIEVVAHVILGLPGEGPREMAATARYLGNLPLQGVKIHLLYVVRGSALERLYQSGNYRPLEEGEYVNLVADFLEMLPPNLVIHRLTGDPHPEELVAPAWCGQKSRVLMAIKAELARRGSRQGSAREDFAGRRLPFESPPSCPRKTAT